MKRSHKHIDQDEKRLAKLLFHNPDDFAEKLRTTNDCDSDIDEKAPAWHDDDDDNNFEANKNLDTKKKELYSKTLKQKYVNLVGTPNWAKLDKPNVDDTILKTVGHLAGKKKTGLRKDYLEFKKLCKINKELGKEGPEITAVEFHPTSSVALVGGQSGIIALYSIAAEANKLHSFLMPKLPVLKAHFHPDGKEAYLSSSNSHNYCVYDLMKAKRNIVQFPIAMGNPTIFELSPDGKYFASSSGGEEVLIISTKARELVRILKHNNPVAAVIFGHDNEKIFTLGVTGEVCVWNMNTFRVESKFYDEGCVNGSKINISKCGKLLATGSREGIVNIYESSSLSTMHPAPVKTIQHLRTEITNIIFNSTTEILAVSSKYYPNSVKLVHIPTYHVFNNFPDQSTNFNNIGPVSFSPNSGYMAFGNNKSSAMLFRLKYFKNY